MSHHDEFNSREDWPSLRKPNRDPQKSAQPCGCDPGAEWKCQPHAALHEALDQLTKQIQKENTLSQNEANAADAKKTLGETRVTDPTTGGQKGQKDARFDLIPPEAEWGIATLFGIGSRKYADRNWERGYKWGLSVGALRRHLNQWMRGESYDPETGCHHLICVAWHAIVLFTFEIRKLGTDDVRYVQKTPMPINIEPSLKL